MAESLPLRFGSYILLRRLGRGASGDVHLARPREKAAGLPTLLVVKRMHAALVENDELVKRFAHEAKLAAKIDSPHVARVYDAGHVNDLLFIAMEYIPGWSLVNVLHRLHEERRPMPVGSARNILVHALRGLEALHNAKDPDTASSLDFVHRDIAPKNIMLGDDGVTRLIDLGLGRSSLKDWQTQTGMVMGSPGYMPPEQVLARTLDIRTDLYAMGVVLFEVLTGRPYIPVGSPTERLKASLRPQFRAPTAFRKDLPAAVDDVARKAVEVDPDRRYQTATDFRDAVELALPRTSDDTAGTLVSFLLRDVEVEGNTEVIQKLDLDEDEDADPTQPGANLHDPLVVRAASGFSDDDMFAATRPSADAFGPTKADRTLPIPEIAPDALTPALPEPSPKKSEAPPQSEKALETPPLTDRKYSMTTLVFLSAAAAFAAATLAILIDREFGRSIVRQRAPVSVPSATPQDIRAVRGKSRVPTARRAQTSAELTARIGRLDERVGAFVSGTSGGADTVETLRSELAALRGQTTAEDDRRQLERLERSIDALGQ